MAARVPTLTVARVCHIGTLRAADKGGRHMSWEGHGLSVSVHPDQWERIARLGGLPWWQLTNPQGEFLDAHGLSRAARRRIHQWAASEGYTRPGWAWRVDRYDDELDVTITSLFDTHDEAADEIAWQELDARPRRVRIHRHTSQLEDRLGMRSPDGHFDHLLVAWIEDHHQHLDGVWWADQHGPLSAPRGVILPGRLADWHAEPLPGRAFRTDDEPCEL